MGRVARGVNDEARVERRFVGLSASGWLTGTCPRRRGLAMSAHVHIDWDKVGRIGLYTVPMAAKLIGESGTKIRSWIDGYSNSDAAPIAPGSFYPKLARPGKFCNSQAEKSSIDPVKKAIPVATRRTPMTRSIAPK